MVMVLFNHILCILFKDLRIFELFQIVKKCIGILPLINWQVIENYIDNNTMYNILT